MAWRTAKSLILLRAQIDALAPHRSRASDGTIGDAAHAAQKSDHNPWVMDGAVGVVTAIDITHDAHNGCDAGKLVEQLIASRDPRIKYIIWNSQIISAVNKPWQLRAYTGKNPHTHHFHLSVLPERALYDLEHPWPV
jgi:hypothetical protein